MTTTDMTVFAGNGEVSKVTVLKAGGTSTMPLTMKVYGYKHGVKGQELKRRYAQYRMDRGLAGNASLSSLLASGQLLAERVTKRVDKSGAMLGLTVGFTLPGRIVSATGNAEAAAETLTNEQLLAIIAKREAAAPATPEAPKA